MYKIALLFACSWATWMLPWAVLCQLLFPHSQAPYAASRRSPGSAASPAGPWQRLWSSPVDMRSRAVHQTKAVAQNTQGIPVCNPPASISDRPRPSAPGARSSQMAPSIQRDEQQSGNGSKHL